MDSNDAFLVALSAMATNMTVTGMSHVPTDTMLVLDVSASMGPGQNNVASELIKAANESIASLLSTNSHSRVGVVLYSGPTTQGGSATANDAVLILPLGRYKTQNDVYLNLSNNRVSLNNNVVIEGTNNRPTTANKSVTGGTYIQKGVMLAANQLTADELDTTINDSLLGTIKRKPVMVLMSDGSPTFSSTNFQNPTSINLGDGTATSSAQGFVNQLTAAYAKSLVEEKYKTEPLFYTIGLGVSNDAVALSVLDPDNARASVAVNDFWTEWNNATVGNTVTVQSGTWWSSARTVTKIAGLEQNYVDEFINVTNNGSGQGSLGDRLIQAFADIVSKINLQSQYKPTLISQSGENHSGFISFVDKVGEYMQVSDVKGILINDTLYSGADLASNFVAGGGNLGTFDNPTQLGHEMVAAVRERIGLANDDEARTLIGLAYEYGQIRFNNANDYSNYIGWYADANSKFLGFYQDGVTNITDPTAVYTIKSYGYLGVEHDSNMMYATVQVRHNIKNGEETVAFAVPAALIPVMTYNVSLDENGNLLDIELSGSNSPIRLVYEVALDSHINEWNVKEVVSADYLADSHNVNADGSINFYTNDWEHTNNTGYNTVNTYSYFNPSRQNDKYYFTSDAPIYADTNGTLYAGSAAPDTKGTFYNAFTVYEKDGSALSKKTIYRQLSEKALETAEPTDGTNNYHIPSGDVHVNLEGYTIRKDPNETNTLNVANQPFVDIYGHNVNDTNHSFYVGATLGNNGKLTLTSQTGIKLSKEMADGVAAPNTPFIFDIYNETDAYDGSIYPALLVKADGSEVETSVLFDDGNATVELYAGEVLYIGNLLNGETFRIAERKSAEYIATATGLSGDGTVTISENELKPVSFVNDERGTGNLSIAKEVEHDFGQDYNIPADKLFTMQVILRGIGTANATFQAEHTGGGYSSITTDAHGQFTVQIAHEQQFEVYGLPAGTVATVIETAYGDGFAPTYWNNGVASANAYGEVTIVKDNTSSVIVVNDYVAQKVYPVNLNLGGEKIVKDADNEVVENWDADWEFEIVLERYGANGWYEVSRETVNDGKKSFSFDMSKEEYDKPGVYSYQLYEIEPDIDDINRVEGMIYDLTWHTFSVYVSDADMDGQLEIVRVYSDHTNKDFEMVDGEYTVKANFENVQTVTVPALATVDIKKHLTNDSGSPLVSLAGYNFGLYTDAECTTPAAIGNGISAISYNPTDSVGEGWIDIQFSESGQYTFYVKEIAGSINKMSYSTEVIKVVADVSIHSQNANALVANVTYYKDGGVYNLNADSQVEFTNVYNPADAELAIDFVSKELSGRTLLNGEFTFEVQTQNGTTVLTGSNNAKGVVTFNDTLNFDKVDNYYYNIVETSADGKGVTVDKTTYRIVVTVCDVNGQLTATYDVINAVDENILFKNTYKAADTTYAISGQKNLTGRALLNDEFTFVLTEALNAQGEIADGAKTYETHNEFGGRFTFPEITYTEAGTYYYVVTEKQNSGSSYGIKYDTNKFVVTVTVRDDIENGKLVASANLDADDIVFNNRYVANPVSKRIDGEKVLNGKTLVGGQFSFELWQSNAEWTTVNVAPIQTVANDGEGNFAFSFVDYTSNNAADFTKTGTYYYLIKEVDGGLTIKGITYDDVIYRVRVEITDDLLGQLHATAHIYDNEGVPQESIIFRNSYEITGDNDLTVSGTKKLNNAVPENRTFEFELYKANDEYEIDGNYIQKVSQNANGNFEFTINYKPKDISDVPYYYVVKETNAGQKINGVTYDNTVYHIEVMVEDDGEGGVKSTAIIRKGESIVTSLDFANTYKADSVGVVFDGEKVLEGNRKVKANDYTFEIFNANENFETISSAAPAAKNDAERKFEFGEITLDTAKTYYFVVKENSANALNGVTYDTSKYHITVKVIDNEQTGKLEVESITYARVKGENSAEANGILFENSYKASNATASIAGSKTLENRTLAENEFKFFLYPANENYVADAEATVMEAKNNADGSFSFDALTFEEIGTYYFVISEDAETTAERVTNDTSVYHVAIEIKDDEDGKLYEAGRVIRKVGSDDAVESIVFNNIFTPKPEDITVNIGVAKTVVNKGSEKIGPEGFEFVLENTVTNEKWNVKSDTDGNAKFTLGYTEDDIGKTYTYKLTEVNGGKANVTYSNAEYTITVAIELNENNELVATLTKNGENVTEIIAEFENVYDYTPTPEYPDSPRTGDNTNLHLWFALLFVSGGGIIGTTLHSRKRKEEN
jgi:pilin isopeptide linkage protein